MYKFIKCHYWSRLQWLGVLVLLFGISVARANESVSLGSGSTDADSFGNTTTFQKFAQQFTISNSEDIASTTVCIATSGSPTDNVVVSYVNDSGGLPGTTVYGSTQLSYTAFGSTVVPCAGTQTFSDVSGLGLSPGTYWEVFSRSGTLDDTNLYYISLSNGGSLSIAAYNGSVWRQSSLGTSKNWIQGNINFMTGTPASGGTNSSPNGSEVWGTGNLASTTFGIIDNPNQDVFNAMILFLAGFFGVIWVFAKKR